VTRTPGRRRVAPDRAEGKRTAEPAGDGPYAQTPGHAEARGTLPMARKLIDPAIEVEIQALAAEAPLPTPDQAARLARLLRLRHVSAPRPPDDGGTV